VRAESLNDRWTLPESSATQPSVSQYDTQVYKPRVLPKGHDPAKANPFRWSGGQTYVCLSRHKRVASGLGGRAKPRPSGRGSLEEVIRGGGTAAHQLRVVFL
jgi:hypothetical protein